MFNSVLKKVHRRLSRNKFFGNIFNVLEKTPVHAIHWYVFMFVGLTITLVNVGLAWFIFSGVSAEISTGLEQNAKAATINREELREALDVYQARSTEFTQLKRVPPKIIDPGR